MEGATETFWFNPYQTEDYFLPLIHSLVWEVLLGMWSSFPPVGQMSQTSPCHIHDPVVHLSQGTSKHFSLLNKLSSDADFQTVDYTHCILRTKLR